jgi:integrase
MRTARRQGKPLRRPKPGVTIDDYWEQWWAKEVTVAKARATQYSYRANYASYIGPRIGNIELREVIDDPQLLVDWRSGLAREKSQSALEHAQRVLSSLLSAAAEQGVIPHNPLLLLPRQRSHGRARTVARTQAKSAPVAVDLVAWYIVLDYLRRPTRPAIKGDKPRTRRYPLDRERDALIVALGFMAGFRLPSEALGLTRGDVRKGRLHMEGRSSSGEYTVGSKTGSGRDMPLRPELVEEFDRFERACCDAGLPLGRADFWISTRQDGSLWSEHQAHNWREREFRPVARQVAADFPQFRALRDATPYAARHTFMSCCLQAGISPATIAAWCGTSMQMISKTYGRTIRRYEGASPVPLDEQFQSAKAEAMPLLAGTSTASQGDTSPTPLPDGSPAPTADPTPARSGSGAEPAPIPSQGHSGSPPPRDHANMPRPKRRRVSA